MANYQKIRDLSNAHEKWIIKVRVTRMWDVHNWRTGNHFVGINMVFLDENDDHIVARTFGKPLSDKFRAEFKEGGVYLVELFSVMDVVEPYRPVTNDLYIKLKWQTTVSPVDNIDSSINLFKFEFVKYDQLAGRLNRHKYLTDVIGRITKVGESFSVKTRFGPKNIRNLQIEDETGQSVDLSLWEGCALQVDGQIIRATSIPVVIIVTSVTVGNWNGKQTLYSTAASKVYLDLDIPERKNILDSFRVGCGKVADFITSTHGMRKDWHLENRNSVSAIKELSKLSTNKHAKYTFLATIKEVNVGSNWYYMACPQHNKKMTLVDGVFQCEICKTHDLLPEPRYMLIVKVSDGTDDVELLLFDSYVKQLLDYSAEYMFQLSNQAEGGIIVFQMFESLIGKSCVFQVQLSDYNRQNGVDRLTVTRLLIPEDLSNKFEAEVEVHSPPSKRQCIVNSTIADTNQTPTLEASQVVSDIVHTCESNGDDSNFVRKHELSQNDNTLEDEASDSSEDDPDDSDETQPSESYEDDSDETQPSESYEDDSDGTQSSESSESFKDDADHT